MHFSPHTFRVTTVTDLVEQNVPVDKGQPSASNGSLQVFCQRFCRRLVPACMSFFTKPDPRRRCFGDNHSERSLHDRAGLHAALVGVSDRRRTTTLTGYACFRLTLRMDRLRFVTADGLVAARRPWPNFGIPMCSAAKV